MRAPFLWLPLLLAFTIGCNHQDTEALRRISKKVAARTTTFTGEIKTGATTSWNSVQESSVEARVAARLRWDQQLEDISVEVHASGGAVELQGKVRNLNQRRRAVMLAETTAGVESVKDSLIEADR